MTVLDERIKRIQDVGDTVSAQALEDIYEQGKKCAANMLLMYGGAVCKDAAGFVNGVQRAHEASLLWLLAEGYVTLTDKALASGDEQQAKRNRRKLAMNEEATPTEGAQALTGSRYL